VPTLFHTERHAGLFHRGACAKFLRMHVAFRDRHVAVAGQVSERPRIDKTRGSIRAGILQDRFARVLLPIMQNHRQRRDPRDFRVVTPIGETRVWQIVYLDSDGTTTDEERVEWTPP
jgi:hypothetical protein